MLCLNKVAIRRVIALKASYVDGTLKRSVSCLLSGSFYFIFRKMFYNTWGLFEGGVIRQYFCGFVGNHFNTFSLVFFSLMIELIFNY